MFRNNAVASLRRLTGRLAEDRRGVTAIISAIGLVVIMGFAGLAVDIAAWLNAVRGLQAAADQSAYSAALAAGADGCSSAAATVQAKAVAAARGYIDGVGNTRVSVDCNARASTFTIGIAQVQPLWFARLFLSGPPTASATATAQLAGKVSDVCVLALDGTDVAQSIVGSDDYALQLAGNTNVNLHCGVAVDSSSTSALAVRSGSATMSATDLYIVGNEPSINIPFCQPSQTQGCATTTPTANNLFVHQPPVPDPYAGRTFPTPSSCTFTNFAQTTPTGSNPLRPGVYCGGMALGATGQGNDKPEIDLAAGTYYVVGGSLTINSRANIVGGSGGVTFVLTGNALGHSDYATLRINGGAVVSLAAPTSGPFGGLVFFQDRNAPFAANATCGNGNAQNKINGGSNQKITGAVYFPNQSVCFNGNSNTTGVGRCTQLIARTFDFTGTSDVRLSCDGTGVSAISVIVPQLVR